MAMTEKQGGSDLRQTQTTATKKFGWDLFARRARCFLRAALGRVPDAGENGRGVSCFVVAGRCPRFPQSPKIQRLKDKCGNRLNASSEVDSGCHCTSHWRARSRYS